MDPKLMRMYSDILNEGPATNPQAQQSGFNWSDPFGLGAAARARQAQQNAANSVAANNQSSDYSGRQRTSTQPGGAALPTAVNNQSSDYSGRQRTSTQSGRTALPARPAKPPAKPPVDAMKGSDASATNTSTLGGPRGVQTTSAATPAAPAAAAPSGPAAGTTAALDQAKAGIAAGGVPAAAPTGEYNPETDPSLAAGRAELAKPGAPSVPVGLAAATTAPASPGTAALPSSPPPGGGGQKDAFGPVTQVAQPQTATANPMGTGSGGSSGTGADMSPGNYMRAATKAFQEESELAEDELAEEQLEEAFNDMLRLSGIQLNEKAVSKQQQKFMGMVHAMQKGEKVKGASPELKKAAKSMGKKDARDFAATKHKGLPQKVNEGIHLMLDEDGHTLEHIVNRYKHEVRRFIEGDFMPENLYDALYDYYMDRGDMPYGVAKAREGDPYQWVSERFYDDVMRDLGNGMNETAQPVMDDTLNELAQLAGLAPAAKDISLGNIARKSGEFVGQIEKGASDTAGAIKRGMSDIASNFQAGREAGKKPEFGPAFTKGVDPSLRTTPDAKMSPKPMPRELPSPGLGSLPSPKVGYGARGPGSENPLRESEINECGDMGMDQRDTINVSTNMSSDGNKSVNISAQGEKAEELLAMLKLAGMGDKPRFNTDDGVDLDHPGAIEIHGTMDADGAEQLAKQLRHASMSEQEMMDEAKKTRTTKYKNTPDEEYQSVASITRQGNDLNREKRQYAGKPRLGDNPMAEGISLEEQFEALYNSVLVKEADPKRTGQAEIYTADLGIQPPSPDEGPVGKAATTPTQSPTTGKPAQSGLAGALKSAPSFAAVPTGTGASGFPVQGTQTSRQSALAGFKSAQGAGPAAKPAPTSQATGMEKFKLPGPQQAAGPAPGTKR